MVLDHEKIRTLRARYFASQEEFGEKLGLSQTTVSRAETSGDLKLKTIRKIADALGVHALDLFKGGRTSTVPMLGCVGPTEPVRDGDALAAFLRPDALEKSHPPSTPAPDVPVPAIHQRPNLFGLTYCGPAVHVDWVGMDLEPEDVIVFDTNAPEQDADLVLAEDPSEALYLRIDRYDDPRRALNYLTDTGSTPMDGWSIMARAVGLWRPLRRGDS